MELFSPEMGLRLGQQKLVAEFVRFAIRTDNFQAILDQASVVAAPDLAAAFA